MIPAWYLLGVYVALYSQAWSNFYTKLVFNIVFDLAVGYTTMMWTKYGQENMANMKLHGNYAVGFKRFKSSDKGTDCLVFYPADK
jgi:hypothetical protein